MKSSPLVSLCLLTFNRADCIGRSIESLLAQSYGHFELIINDDGSTDETEIVCRQYEKRDPRVRYCRNPKNLKYAGNQNAAIVRAQSDYVALVHDGDIYRTDLVEKWTRALANYPEVAFVFNGYEIADAQGNHLRTDVLPFGERIHGRHLFDWMIRMDSSPIFGIVMVRKSCVQAVGPFDERLSTLADVDMWLRLLLRYDAAYLAEPLITLSPREKGHSNHPGNWHVAKQRELIYWLNLARGYKEGLEKERRLRNLQIMFWTQNGLALLWCLRYGHFAYLCRGILHLKTMRRRCLAAIQGDLSPIGQWPNVV